MSLLARSCAALAITALAAGAVTVAPAGVATASSRGGAGGLVTTETRPGPVSIVKPVDTTGAETQPTSQTVRKPKRTTRGAVARAPKPDQTGTFVPFD